MPKQKSVGLFSGSGCFVAKFCLLLLAFVAVGATFLVAENIMQQIFGMSAACFLGVLARIAQAGEHKAQIMEGIEALEELLEKAISQERPEPAPR